MRGPEAHDGRQARPAAPGSRRLTFQIEPAPPFRLDLTVWALRRRAANAVDRWDGTTHRRVLVVNGQPLGIEVEQVAPPERPVLQVAVSGANLPPGTRPAVLSALTRMLGCDRCLTEFYRLADGDPLLGPLARRYRGLKPPRYPTLFEALVNAFACQQVTLSLGILLLNRLAEACATGFDGVNGRAFAFPGPADLAARAPDELRTLGFSRQKALAINELACAMALHRLDAGELEFQDDPTVVARLRQLRGVGRWTAEYVLLRGLGRLHVFPGDDVGARNNLQRWLGLLEPLDYDGVRRALAQWAPFQGLVYLHLLLSSLQLESESHPGPVPRTRRLGPGMLR
ncbi:MAG: DNA-3-methyladenine glycosylase 2 [Geminicoccaceae bacterium]